MTDPIEQARLRLVMNSGRAPWVDDRLLEQYVAAILRYHPDVVRLVEAARRANEVLSVLSSDPPRDVRATVRRQIGDAQAETDSALEPFKEVQE